MTQKSHHDSAVLAKGQQVITACAFIWRMRRSEVQILLAKRADTKKFLPGMYELPGGHIEFGEEIREGLAREILEELQVEVSIGDPFYVYDYINLIKQSHAVEIVYFAQLLNDCEPVINTQDHSEYAWFNEHELTSKVAKNRAILFELNGVETNSSKDPELLAMQTGFEKLKTREQ